MSFSFANKYFKGKVYYSNKSNSFSIDKYKKYIFRCYRKKNFRLYTGQRFTSKSVYYSNLTNSRINILDDGLSSYGVAYQQTDGKLGLKWVLKNLCSTIMRTIGLIYFPSPNNAHTEKFCDHYLVFPEKKGIDKNLFKVNLAPYYLSNVKDKVKIASFSQSRDLVRNNEIEQFKIDDESLILHPKFLKKINQTPTEVLALNSKEVEMQLSSIIFYLIAVSYSGKLVLRNTKDNPEFLTVFDEELKKLDLEINYE
ncbi:hypothetical protein [Vibrio sp. Evd11]|uniref:hypothetical protein n=1 Tax=Vibrio sp. Evd11 TaxID=1207404 RepID=UPI0013C49DE3|nr:hypothetical protein [Vibrio sp. Evd11]